MKRAGNKNITKPSAGQSADNVALLPAGKIYGLRAETARKSTLLHIATNRLFADQGAIFIDGETVVENDLATGKVYLMSTESVSENMKVKRAFKEGKFFYPVLTKVPFVRWQPNLNWTQVKDQNLSTGYQSPFKLIMAIASTHRIFLDELVLDWMPTIGLYTKSC